MPIIRNPFSLYTEDTKTPSSSGYRKIDKKINLLNQKMDGLYKDIYITRPDNRQNMDSIIDKLDQAIDNLQDSEMNVSNLSELLRRIDRGSNSNSYDCLKSVEELFGNQNLINSLFANENIIKYIAAQNHQYDLICKYIPKLQDALEIKRDNVLCSDNFSKEFINPKSVKSSKLDAEAFSVNTQRLENKYDISNFFEKTYMNCSKYGEDFIYVVPYPVAFERLIRRSNNRKLGARLGQLSFYESADSRSSREVVEVVQENFIQDKEYQSMVESVKTSMNGADILSHDDLKFKGCKVNLHFNDSNVINESINEMAILDNVNQIDRFRSLSSLHESSLQKDFENIKFENDGLSASANDGLIIPDNLNRDPKKIDKNINGAVLERLPRENVIPIYIGKKCLGYYYLEFKEDKNACGFCGGNHMTPGISNSINYGREMSENQQELAIRYISSKISTAIDTHFINTNKDLKEEIYAILQYNEKFDISRSNDIGVTFIPAEDIIHCYFEIDENTHRGISDLQRAVVPAMLYILLYLTDIIGKITRSTDKRIYYVKQNVETNVARTMMNVVQQIKKGNMGMRQIESMNNILNIVGKYNDYIIPLGQSGDAPIQFEVMNGQDIQTPTEIMEKMEEAAVNTIMPLELVNSTFQQDFAIRFTMSNTRFLKSIYNRQRVVQKFISRIYTKVYNYEFNENNSFITVILPPPTYLTMTNTQQLIDNIIQSADKIIELELSKETDEVKAEFKRIYVRSHLSTYLDYNSIERILSTAKVNVEADKLPATEESDSYSDDTYSDY